MFRGRSQGWKRALATHRYVILGGGNSAGYAAREFVKYGQGSRLAIVGEEPQAPYERPALSKGFLGASNPARLPNFHTCVGGGGDVQPESWYRENGIDARFGTSVHHVDLHKRTLDTSDGTISYEKLLIATGCDAVRLQCPGHDLKGIQYLRNYEDGLQLVESMKKASRAVVVGGGYIGMEVAAGLQSFGVPDITMVFPEKHLLQRLFEPELAAFYEEHFTGKGVRLHKEAAVVSGFEEQEGHVKRVLLQDGSTLDADLVVVGIGARPRTELFKGVLELADDGGIPVNSMMQTRDPNVFAMGDIASFPSSRTGSSLRVEHVGNARATAQLAALTAMGKEAEEYDYLPFFYSRVWGLSWQFYGEKKGELVVIRQEGEQGSSPLAAFWVDQDCVQGVFLEGGSDEENSAACKIAHHRVPVSMDRLRACASPSKALQLIALNA